MADNIDIIAKLHDLLKLEGSQYHWCPDKHPLANEFKKKHPSLWKGLKHHCVFWSYRHGCHTQVDRAAFCLSVADHKSSAISRRLSRIYSSRGVYRVWKDEPSDYQDADIIPDILQKAITYDTLSDLYKAFSKDFEARAETMRKQDGSSFTSLRTHSELTAAWFRYFLNNADYYQLPQGTASTYAFRKNMFSGKVLLVRCKIRTHGRLARLRDLQIVKDIFDKKREVIEALGNVVLYELPDEILIPVCPDSGKDIADKLESILSTNHYVEFTIVETPLRNSTKKSGQGFLHNFGELFREYPYIAYPNLPLEIAPIDSNSASSHAIICDLCQLAAATVEYPGDVYTDEVDPVNEYLCESCKNLRQESKTRSKTLCTWEKSLESEGPEESAKPVDHSRVCMVKISLNMKELVSALVGSFEKTFSDKLRGRSLDKQDLGFSILHEFVLDYNRFIKEFEAAILALEDGRYSGVNNDHLLDGFMVLRIEKDCDIASIARKYVELYNKYFPRLKGPVFPIKLSISCSHIKHPFLEHWDMLDNPINAINIQSVRRAKLEINLDQFAGLEEFGRCPEEHVSKFLHDLAEIYDRTGSELLVKFHLLDKQNNQRKVVKPFMQGKVNPCQILSYYKLFVQDAKP